MKRLTGFVSVSIAVLSAKCASPPVKVSLRSSWSAPPILTEILETVSIENPDGFFTYLDRLTDPEQLVSSNSLTPEATHNAALQIAVSNELLKQPGSLASVELSLALHAATPKIEAFYQYYEAHHNNSTGNRCGSWVDWYGQAVCEVETLKRLAGVETIDPSETSYSTPAFPRPQTLTFDHIYPPPGRALERPARTAILYASLSSPNFRELHSYLLSLADSKDTNIEYVFRHIPPSQRGTARNYLSGYGVALDLKKMDYLALDDRYSHPQKINDAKEAIDNGVNDLAPDPVLALIQAHPENITAPDIKTPLSEIELEELGPRVTQIIYDSFNPLKTLSYISQNFPKYATSLARRVVVNTNISDELHANSLKAPGGVNMLWLNGMILDAKDIQPLSLLRTLRKERTIISALVELGLQRSEAFQVLTHEKVGAAQRGGAVLDGVFDASDREEGGDVIMWWNDMEKDSRYSRWNPSLYTLLRPLYPGQFPNIKRNLFNVILVIDISQTTSLNFIAGPMANILNRSFPFRFGLVPATESEDGKKMALLFHHISRTYGRKKTLAFLTQISQVKIPPHLQTPSVDWNIVHAAFEELVQVESESAETGYAGPSLNAILNGESERPGPLEKIASYMERLGATRVSSPQGHVFFNGKHFDMNDDFLRSLQVEMGHQLNFLQERVYEGTLSDDAEVDMGHYFYDLPSANKRRNRYIYPANGGDKVKIVNMPELLMKTRFKITSASFVYPDNSEVIPLSLYVIADLDSEEGLSLVKEALFSVGTNSPSRVSFIHNPSNSSVPHDTTASQLISHLLSKNLLSRASPSRLLQALGIALPQRDENTQTHLARDEVIRQLSGSVNPKEFNQEAYADYVTLSRLILRELQIKAGESALLVNGRVVGPISSGEFNAADFRALEEYEMRKRTQPVVEALKSVAPATSELDRAMFANIVSMVSSIIASTQQPDPSEIGLFDAPQRPRQTMYQVFDSNFTAFHHGDNSTALYHIAAIVDPLSTTAQKWSSLLQWLSNIPDMYIEIHLNPARYKDIPLKQFYRYNLLPSLAFDEAGEEISAQAIFEDLPVDPIYTLAMDVPSSWLVRPREALYDLDNIQLGHLLPEDTSVEAIFDLDYLVVEGHAREAATNSPPRGVQVQLVDSDSNVIDDTQVVANLGYLQFKAKPGVFGLEIREGRGRKIFRMESVGNEGWDSPSVGERGNEITVTSFEGLTLYPRFVRNSGMEIVDVLEDEEQPKTGWVEDITSKVKSLFMHKTERTASVIPVKQQAEINIFTVASGLLYERFVGIMILSVLRNTNSTVKFWFIENFLSPSFLEFIPHMAKEYNFQYELVTYKWPSWLRAQTEKQRIIWAYKILFLDVLFPMDLKKVIFVDADQIVRADLKELVDLDLQGAPYGYTPMGNDNLDMEGFRFWKTGYWEEFLQGRPYHISALYVIDLVKFRQMAAGDILRGQYQALSADPNSLANLDQDLPNNLQKEVPIFSLHEDWLWCETWCSKDRLDRAKTIDLCQNPLTKEPKLARARQIPEWEEYDGEIARFTRQLAEEGKIHSRMATADANVLAGAGNTVTPDSSASEQKTVDEEAESVEGTVESQVPQRDEL